MPVFHLLSTCKSRPAGVSSSTALLKAARPLLCMAHFGGSSPHCNCATHAVANQYQWWLLFSVQCFPHCHSILQCDANSIYSLQEQHQQDNTPQEPDSSEVCIGQPVSCFHASLSAAIVIHLSVTLRKMHDFCSNHEQVACWCTLKTELCLSSVSRGSRQVAPLASHGRSRAVFCCAVLC